MRRVPVQRIWRLLADVTPERRARAEAHARSECPGAFIEGRGHPFAHLPPDRDLRDVVRSTGTEKGIPAFAGVHPARIAFYSNRGPVPAAGAGFEHAPVLSKPGERNGMTAPSAASFHEARARAQPRERQRLERAAST